MASSLGFPGSNQVEQGTEDVTRSEDASEVETVISVMASVTEGHLQLGLDKIVEPFA